MLIVHHSGRLLLTLSYTNKYQKILENAQIFQSDPPRVSLYIIITKH